jgi:uncharacterized repeat protein (TIGR03803 family)
LCPWQETVLHRFTSTDGSFPQFGDLAFDTSGNVYGTTYSGGANGFGTVYQLNRSQGWAESVLYSFSGLQDGGNPIAGVTFDSAGTLYGTASDQSSPPGYGTVYRLTPSGSGWSESTIHTFDDPQGGAYPWGGLVIDQSGNLYGATDSGGPGGYGTVYELTPSSGSWNFTLLYGFSGAPSVYPDYNLLLAGGNLYGTLLGDADQGFGAAFELTPSNGSWTEIVLHVFTYYAGTPKGSLVMDSVGNLYGTGSLGGSNGCGFVYRIAP